MKTVKKLLALALALVMLAALAACGSGSSSDGGGKTPASASDLNPKVTTPAADDGDTTEVKVAVVKLTDHASLDEIAAAVTAELDKLAEMNQLKISYTVASGRGDRTALRQLCDQAVADKVNVIIPIGTAAAQVAAESAAATQTPVVFAAVSDPAGAKLTGIPYVTGTSDALDTGRIMDMIFAQNPNAQKIGLLYSPSEQNSEQAVKDAKAYLQAKGVAFTEQTADTKDEVAAAAKALIAEKVDAVFTPADNVVMAAESAIYESLAAAGIPHYAGADSFVRSGAFAACGVNYTELGTRTADIAFHVVAFGMDGVEDFYQIDGGVITVNTETAAAVKADWSAFKDMGELVEVVTDAG